MHEFGLAALFRAMAGLPCRGLLQFAESNVPIMHFVSLFKEVELLLRYLCLASHTWALLLGGINSIT